MQASSSFIVPSTLLFLCVTACSGPEASAERPSLSRAETAAVDCPELPVSLDKADIKRFFDDRCYLLWEHDVAIRDTGPRRPREEVGDYHYGNHGSVMVYYSPQVATWMVGDRTEPIEDGQFIVKEMFWPPGGVAPGTTRDEVVDANAESLPFGAAWMGRNSGASYDGWLWGYYDPNDPMNSEAEYGPGHTGCQNCHSEALNKQTFASDHFLHGLDSPAELRWSTWSDTAPAWNNASGKAIARERAPLPYEALRADFGQEYAGDEDLDRGLSYVRVDMEARERVQATVILRPEIVEFTNLRLFPNSFPFDHVFAKAGGPTTFLTSDQCLNCHNASQYMEDYIKPNMVEFSEPGAATPHEWFDQRVESHPPEDQLTQYNLGPYDEWSGSLMGMSGRDPVFLAQVEREKRLRPDAAQYIDNTCYSCHGAMGQRQLAEDSNGERLFSHEMLFAEGDEPDAMYGALARDGISCTFCHRLEKEGLGEFPFTGQTFQFSDPDVLYGPFEENLKTKPMQNALGTKIRGAEHFKDAELCGSCHNILLPVVTQAFLDDAPDHASADPFRSDAGLSVHNEQSTFAEWQNSQYSREGEAGRTCQGCHMPSSVGDGPNLQFKIANIQDGRFPQTLFTLPLEDRAPETRDYRRHTLNGINVFTLGLFQQFRDMLGVIQTDYTKGALSNLTLALDEGVTMAARKTTEVSVAIAPSSPETLAVDVRVQSLVGHKFPSGVGFRRAFLDLSVLDADGEVLWASGRTNNLGQLVDAQGSLLRVETDRSVFEPHHQLITRQDQVQIYEEVVFGEGNLERTTSFLSIFHIRKDNRLLPKGFVASDETWSQRVTQPTGTESDPDYGDNASAGANNIRYEIPRSDLSSVPARVVATVYYQALPPLYLHDLLESAPPQVGKFAQFSETYEQDKLYYMLSHVNLEGTAIENWKLQAGQGVASVLGH